MDASLPFYYLRYYQSSLDKCVYFNIPFLMYTFLTYK